MRPVYSFLRSHRRWLLALSPPLLAWLAFVGVAFWRSTFVAPAPTLLVRDRAGRFVGELPDQANPRDERLGFWEVGELPERVVAATLAIEDRRFWWHPGVDPLAIARALRQNASSEERVSGASTLAMQVARLQHPGARGYLRKALEAATAWLATARYGREGVLRHYLRIVPYGHRIHGIAYAARRYLDKPVEDLSWAEIAFLAAIPQSPSRMDPYEPEGRRRAIRRGRQILARLAARGTLTPVDLAAANAEIDHLALPWKGERAEAALHALLHYDALVPAETRRRLPLITSTLDLDLQREVEALAWRTVRDASDRGAGNASVLVVDRERWEVLAAVSSTGYFDADHAGRSTTFASNAARGVPSSRSSSPRRSSSAPSRRRRFSTTSSPGPPESSTPTPVSSDRCCRGWRSPTRGTSRRSLCSRSSVSTRPTASSPSSACIITSGRRSATASAWRSARCR